MANSHIHLSCISKFWWLCEWGQNQGSGGNVGLPGPRGPWRDQGSRNHVAPGSLGSTALSRSGVSLMCDCAISTLLGQTGLTGSATDVRLCRLIRSRGSSSRPSTGWILCLNYPSFSNFKLFSTIFFIIKISCPPPPWPLCNFFIFFKGDYNGKIVSILVLGCLQTHSLILEN